MHHQVTRRARPVRVAPDAVRETLPPTRPLPRERSDGAATPGLARCAVSTHVDRESATGVRMSDHGAVTVDYAWDG